MATVQLVRPQPPRINRTANGTRAKVSPGVGPRGPQGLPGVNAVPADAAVGGYVAAGGSASRAAVDARVAAGITGKVSKGDLLRSVVEAGADPTGVASSVTAFNTTTGRAGWVPEGDYLIDDTVKLGKFSGPGVVRKAGEIGRMLGVGEDVYTRRVVHELPFRFPGYTTALTNMGGSTVYLFPQAMAICEQRIYILYGGFNVSNVATGSLVAIHNALTGAFISCFLLTTTSFAEGLVVKRDSGVLRLYARTASNVLGRWDLTTTPTNLSTVTAGDTYTVGVQSQFTWDGAKWTIQQYGPQFNTSARHNWLRYGSSLAAPERAVRFDPSDMMPVDSDLIPLNVKCQGTEAYAGGYACFYGSTHIAGDPLTPQKYPGIRLFASDGTRIADGVVDPETFISTLQGAGCTVALIEGEGGAAYRGALYGLWVTQSHTYTGAHGIVITQELVGDLDFSTGAAKGALNGLAGLNGFIDHSATGIVNPLDGSTFTTLEQIIEFMRDAQVNSYGFHSSGSTITDLAGVTIPTGVLVEIRTGNYFSWAVNIRGADRDIQMWISGAAGALTQTTPFDRRTGTGTPEGNLAANVRTIYLNNSGGAGTTLYVKQTGTGNTGWAGK